MFSLVQTIQSSLSRIKSQVALASLLTIAIFSQFAQADVILTWSAPTTDQGGGPITGLAGYKIHYGNAARTYSVVVDVGNVTNRSLSLGSGTYYFAVTAYDPNGNESLYSNEVSTQVTPGSPNSTPTPIPGSGNDPDQDGVTNANDNCPLVANADQLDQNANGKGDACEAVARSASCIRETGGLSVVPILSGSLLTLLDPLLGSGLGNTSVAKNGQVVVADVDGSASTIDGFGNLDVTSINSKMAWVNSTISGQKKQHFGKSGKALLCNIDGDTQLDQAVLQEDRFISKSSLTKKKLNIALKKYGEIKAVHCADLGYGSGIDQLVVVHSKKKSRKLAVSVLDLKSKQLIEQRSTEVSRFSAQSLADTDGNGVVEVCFLQAGKLKSNISCADSSGSLKYEVPFKVTQLAGGNFISDDENAENSIDELALLSADGKLSILGDGLSHETVLSSAIGSSKKQRIAQCR